MKGSILLRLLFLLMAGNALGQVPAISNISKKNLYPKGTIVITGSGFSSNSSNLRVIFGHVEGQIISSSDFSIEVEVPPAAKFSNVEVINTSSRRMTKSKDKFLPTFYGNGFTVADFSSSTTFTSPQELRDICSCDLNSDGKPDLITSKFSAASDIMVMKNTTNSATPDIVTFDKELHSVGFSTDHISCGDVDGDGRPDLVLTKGGSTNRNAVFLMLNKSTATSIILNAPFSIPLDVNHVATQANIRDLNGDGRPEVIVTNTTTNVIYILQNDPSKPLGANPFITPATKIAVTGTSNTYGLDVQDMDGDGLPDIIVNPISSPDHFILLNQSSATIAFGEAQKITLPGELRNVTTADLSNDGKPDIISTSTNTNRALVLINNSSPGSVQFSSTPITLTTDNGPWGVSVSDIDGDTYPDIMVSHQLTATVNVFLHDGNNASPSFSRHVIPTARPARNLVTGDFNGDGKPDIAVATHVIGTYSVDILRNTICHKPKILNEAPIYICNNPVVLETIPALNVTYDWRRDGTNVQSGLSRTYSATVGGTYTVSASTISPADECTAVVSESFTVTGSTGSVPENPVLTIDSPICSGADLTMSTTSAPGASYKWTGPAGWTTTTTTSSATITNAGAAQAGSYSVQIIAGNCKSNESTPKVVDIVAVNEIKITSTSPTNSACQPNPVKLTATQVSGFTYAWKKDNEAYGAATATNTFDAFEDGSYYVRVHNSTLGCPAREIGPVRVAILQVPLASFIIGEPRCSNAPIQFTNTSVVDPAGTGNDAIAPAVFSWNFGDGNTGTGATPTNTYTSGGTTYNVTLTVSYQGVAGCVNSATLPITITSTTVPVITSSPPKICPGETATLSVSPSYTSVSWEHGATGPTIDVMQPGTYTANATDAAGCVVPRSITVASNDVPVLSLTAEATVIPSGQSTQLNATGAHVFEWSPAESLNATNIPDPIASPLTTTTYTVTGSFIGGCTSQAEITITIDGTLVNITVPIAFSPNGDAANDMWIIDGIESYPDCTLNIFDGRGRRIYQKKGYTNDWDGTYEGKPVPAGTYYYVFACPDAQPVTGSVLIFR